MGIQPICIYLKCEDLLRVSQLLKYKNTNDTRKPENLIYESKETFNKFNVIYGSNQGQQSLFNLVIDIPVNLDYKEIIKMVHKRIQNEQNSEKFISFNSYMKKNKDS